MPCFRDADEVYRYLGTLFEEVAADPELGPRFGEADLIVQYQYRKPDAQITVRMREDGAARVDLGETDLEPDLVMTMDADVAHRFWLGQVNVTVALARGQMKAQGPVAKILKLVPATEPIFARYAAKLRDAGRADLLAG
jgi:putative sterol carrier protein